MKRFSVLCLTIILIFCLSGCFYTSRDMKNACSDAYDEGYRDGYEEGQDDGYNSGRDSGFDSGFTEEYAYGYEDALSDYYIVP